MAGEAWSNQLVSLIILVESSTGFSGLFGYNPVPGPGNLILSISANGGTDPYGNVYPPGVTVGGNTQPQVQLVAGNPAYINFPLNSAAYQFNPQILADVQGNYSQMVLGGPIAALANHTDQVALNLNSANTSGTSFANASFDWVDPSGGIHGFFFVDGSGVSITTCKTLVATMPGTGTSALNPATNETWHNVTPPAGWSGTCRYKILAETNFVCVDFELSNATGNGNVVVMTVPALYRFSGAQRDYPLAIQSNIAPASSNQRCFVKNDGTVTTFGLPNPTTVISQTFFYPLD